MGILTRYILWETLKVLAASMAVLTLLLTFGMAGKEGVRNGLPLPVVLSTMPYFLVEMVGYALPGSALLAVCNVFGRMSGQNELVAMKSLGISPYRAMQPVLVLATVLSMATVISFDVAARWSRPGFQTVLSQSLAEIATGVLRAGQSFNSPKFSVAVRQVQDGRLIDPTIRMAARAGQPEVLIVAREAVLRTEPQGMVISCSGAEAEIGAEGEAAFPEDIEMFIPFDATQRPVHRDWLAMREIPWQVGVLTREAEAIRKKLDNHEYKDASAAAQIHLDGVERQVRRLEAEPYRRWANGFSCLAFVLLGSPLAILRRSADFLGSFFTAFMPILVIYYPLLMLSENLSISGAGPPWAFWLGDALLAIAGCLLIRRVLRR